MAYIDRDPRTTDTNDMSAILRSNEGPRVVGRVLNFCAGGMLLTVDSDLDVGDIASFELSGADFCYGGVAEVAHRGDRALGLRFVSWRGHVDRSVRALTAARLQSAYVTDWSR